MTCLNRVAFLHLPSHHVDSHIVPQNLQGIGKQHGEYAKLGGNHHLVLRITKVHLIFDCCDLTSLRGIGIETDNFVTVLWPLDTYTFRSIVSKEVLIVSSLAIGEASMCSDLSLRLS